MHDVTAASNGRLGNSTSVYFVWAGSLTSSRPAQFPNLCFPSPVIYQLSSGKPKLSQLAHAREVLRPRSTVNLHTDLQHPLEPSFLPGDTALVTPDASTALNSAFCHLSSAGLRALSLVYFPALQSWNCVQAKNRTWQAHPQSSRSVRAVFPSVTQYSS